jgi:hypothetical protein
LSWASALHRGVGYGQVQAKLHTFFARQYFYRLVASSKLKQHYPLGKSPCWTQKPCALSRSNTSNVFYLNNHVTGITDVILNTYGSIPEDGGSMPLRNDGITYKSTRHYKPEHQHRLTQSSELNVSFFLSRFHRDMKLKDRHVWTASSQRPINKMWR